MLIIMLVGALCKSILSWGIDSQILALNFLALIFASLAVYTARNEVKFSWIAKTVIASTCVQLLCNLFMAWAIAYQSTSIFSICAAVVGVVLAPVTTLMPLVYIFVIPGRNRVNMMHFCTSIFSLAGLVIFWQT